MSDPELRVSDADRERTALALREHAAAGRLTLEELAERVGAAYEARTAGELEALVRDLPAHDAPPARRRRPTRWLFALFGSTVRDGRLRVRRRVFCTPVFGNVDLDLRGATFEREELTVVVLAAFATADVYVPEGVELEVGGVSIGGHARANGEDLPPRPGTPLVRMRVVALFGGIDGWRVPASWRDRSFREVIRGIRRGEHRELEP